MDAFRVTRGSEWLPQVLDVYEAGFRRSERAPLSHLESLVDENRGEAIAFVEENQVVGASFHTSDERFTYIMFLAVKPGLRGKGYGSQILDWYMKKYPTTPILLEMEQLDVSAPNTAQREARKRFYFRHGFTDLGFSTVELSGIYDFLIHPATQTTTQASIGSNSALPDLPTVETWIRSQLGSVFDSWGIQFVTPDQLPQSH